MRSKLLKKQGATAPVVNKPSYEDEETRALLFPTDAEEEAAIQQAILEDDRGQSIPLEEFKARGERQLEALEAEAKRNLLKKDDRGLRLQES